MKDEISENICGILDAEYVPEEGETSLVPTENTELVAPTATKDAIEKKGEAEEDFQTGRELLNQSAKSMTKALENMGALGEQIETASFWDAYSRMIGQAGQTAKDIMELHQKKDALAAFIDNPHEDIDGGKINIENAIVYTGTTADMQRQLKRQKLEDNSLETPIDIDIEQE